MGLRPKAPAERGVSRLRGLPRHIRLDCVVCDCALGKSEGGMKRLAVVLLMVVEIVVFGSTCFATSEYVIANNNTIDNNSLVVFKLDTASGSLTQIAVLATGGQGLGIPSNEDFANLRQAITPDGACVFALDAGSSDIASFSEVTGYSKVGNYPNAALNANYNGGSLALTPNGKFLYASYSTTQNAAAWGVNSDCSLTFIAAYTPSGGGRVGAIKVSPNGEGLVVPLLVQYGGPNCSLSTRPPAR
jgi:hypothetical protein